MRMKLICVGKLKEKYLKDACSEYSKRISRFGKIEIIEVLDENDERPGALAVEGERILKNVRSGEFVITLEINGEMLSSEHFSDKISDLAVRGISDITFIIGGSGGLYESVSKIADYKLSFSKMTFPHQLARVMLLEQIYRAYKINEGGKYHK